MLFNDIINEIIKEKNIDLNLSDLSNFDIFEKCIEEGISQKEIIEKFEKNLNAPFSNIMEKDPDYSFIKKYSFDKIKEMMVFPYSKENVLHIAIFEKYQIELLDSIIDKDMEYVPVFCFDFLIENKLSQVEEDLETAVDSNIGREVIEVNANKKTILLATGQDNIDNVVENSPIFKHDLTVVGKIHRKEDLVNACTQLNPEILLVGNNIGGKAPLIKTLLLVIQNNPQLRIVFLTGKINPGDELLQINLGLLASLGVYDIITEPEISIGQLENVLLKEKSDINRVKHFIEKIKDTGGKKNNEEIVITVPEEEEEEDDVTVYPNLYSIISPYGGVGKSTIVQNLAIALNNHAMPDVNGKKPKIAIIDLDLQGFSTSRFFDTMNKEKNIFYAIEQAEKAIDDLGELRNLTRLEEEEIAENILNSFIQCRKYKNIYVLGGNDKVYKRGDMNKINSYYLTFIIESIISYFDVVLVDTYTTLECSTIFPLYHMSRTIFNVLDVSTQCFNLNKRYLTFLEDTSIYQSINNKFILNKTINLTETYLSLKDIQSGLNIEFDYIFPKIPDELMFNMSCKGDNIIDSQDMSISKSRVEFFEMANDIMLLKNYDELLSNNNAKPSKKNKTKKQEADKEKKDKNETKSTSKFSFLSKASKTENVEANDASNNNKKESKFKFGFKKDNKTKEPTNEEPNDLND